MLYCYVHFAIINWGKYKYFLVALWCGNIAVSIYTINDQSYKKAFFVFSRPNMICFLIT